MKEKRKKRAIYLGAIPDILRYQIITKTVLAILLYLFNLIFKYLLRSAGKVAITSSDILFLFTSWQGITLLLLALTILVTYTVFDLIGMLNLVDLILSGEEKAVRQSFLLIPSALKRFLEPLGILLILYVSLLTPLIGIGLSISLTENFYIPTFISSVIDNTPLYSIIYTAVMTFLMIVSFIHYYCLHYIILGNLHVKNALKQSRHLMKDNWKDFLRQNIIFFLRMAPAYLLSLLIGIVVFIAVYALSDNNRLALLLLAMILVTLFGLVSLFYRPFLTMKLTDMYRSYTDEERTDLPIRSTRKHPLLILGGILLIALVVVASHVMDTHFDELFPAEVDVPLIAHRGGGNEGVENTVSGLNLAYELGAYGSEIDVQRTKDGCYIINHDSTFARLAGVNKKPEDMTLEEIKELNIQGEKVATIEEMLEASHGKLILFIELKGNTADDKMADDMVRMLKERKMEDEAVLISLNYDLIDYIENKYPEIRTAYLTFLAFGNIADLNCDYIGLEEESATPANISAIHDQNKKVLVWTVNTKESQRYFYKRNIDGMITDEIIQAKEIKQELASRDDLTRILDGIFPD